eukprot:364546-Chlamydomonas_euryale.AAC.15
MRQPAAAHAQLPPPPRAAAALALTRARAFAARGRAGVLARIRPRWLTGIAAVRRRAAAPSRGFRRRRPARLQLPPQPTGRVPKLRCTAAHAGPPPVSQRACALRRWCTCRA